MFCRAGRNGCIARAHLLYTTRQARLLRDPSLTCFASQGNKENCRRKEMLMLLGSSESIDGSAACCDICSGQNVPSPRLDLLVPMPLKRPRKPKPMRHISDDMSEALTHALLHERKKFLDEFPGYRMLGSNFILSDSTIRHLCTVATTLTSVDDLSSIVSLRPELKDRIYHVMWDIISHAPAPKKKERKNN